MQTLSKMETLARDILTGLGLLCLLAALMLS